MKLGTSNCVNYSTQNPKRSAKYVYHTGTLALSAARAGTCRIKDKRNLLRKGRTENQKNFVQYTMDLNIPNYYIKNGRLHRHRYGKKPGDREYYIANSLKKKCKKYYLGIHDGFIRDEKFRENMIDNGRTEEICRQMDDLAVEDHTHHLLPEEIDDYRSNWWIQTRLVPIQCQSGTDLTSNTHCPLCDSSKTKKMQLITTKDGGKAILHLGGTGKNHGGILLTRITTKTYPAPIDQGNLIKKCLGHLFET